MSRAYRISVRESLARHVQVEDGIASSLELLPILAPERMGALLAAELAARGFEREGETLRRRADGGVLVEVVLATGEVSVTAEGHTALDLKAERSAVTVVGNREQRQTELEASTRQALEDEAQATQEALRRRVTAALEGHLKDLKVELDDAVNRVTAVALRQRAGELGQVEEVHEDANGGLVIKVRL
jgi:DNA polymerase II small subunit/DNA polymerase delta subunit B